MNRSVSKSSLRSNMMKLSNYGRGSGYAGRMLFKDTIKSLSKNVKHEHDSSIWEIKPDSRITRLALIILVYLYYEDDDKLSRQELKSIKSVFKDDGFGFNKEEKNELHDILKDRITRNEINRFRNEKDMTDVMYKSAIQLVREIDVQSQYIPILNQLDIPF